MSHTTSNTSAPVPAFPVNKVRFAIMAMTAALLGSAYLTWRMGDEIKHVMRSQVEVVAAAERLQHYGNVLELSIRAVVMGGDAAAAGRYRSVQPQLRTTLHELRGALRLRENIAALRSVDRADLSLVAMEYQALDLASRGDVQAARSLINSPQYAHLSQIYFGGLQDIESRSQAYVEETEGKVARFLKLILGLSFAAFAMIVLGWSALVRPARQWGNQLNDAREDADRARRQIEEQQAGLEELNRKLFDQARIDPLTKLGTRLKFNEDVETLWQRAARYGERYCAIMCDVDNFKQYNDT